MPGPLHISLPTFDAHCQSWRQARRTLDFIPNAANRHVQRPVYSLAVHGLSARLGLGACGLSFLKLLQKLFPLPPHLLFASAGTPSDLRNSHRHDGECEPCDLSGRETQTLQHNLTGAPSIPDARELRLIMHERQITAKKKTVALRSLPSEKL